MAALRKRYNISWTQIWPVGRLYDNRSRFNVIIARKTEIEAKYPGGLSQFRIDRLTKPPERWCEDQCLLSFSSMGAYYGKVRDTLLASGIDVLETSESNTPETIKGRCNWLDCDSEPLGSIPDGATASYGIRYWLKGTEPTETVRFSRKPLLPTEFSEGLA
jgi:hypothetical protein